MWYNVRMITVLCRQCGQPYAVKPYMAARSRFCGRVCYGAWQKAHPRPRPTTRIEVTCYTCGTTFTKQPNEVAPHNFCSRACFGVWRRSSEWRGPNSPFWLGGHTDYRGENWDAQRRAARSRDHDTCQHCGVGDENLPVHHKRPFHLFADYRAANHLDNLITLCPACHSRAEIAFWRAHPGLANGRQFPDCAPVRACRRCGKDFQPRSGAAKVCDACCNATCAQCGGAFYSRKAIHRAIRYCSRECRNAAIRRASQTCAGCGQEYTPRRGGTRYCSRECHMAHSNPRRKSSPTT